MCQVMSEMSLLTKQLSRQYVQKHKKNLTDHCVYLVRTGYMSENIHSSFTKIDHSVHGLCPLRATNDRRGMAVQITTS